MSVLLMEVYNNIIKKTLEQQAIMSGSIEWIHLYCSQHVRLQSFTLRSKTFNFNEARK